MLALLKLQSKGLTQWMKLGVGALYMAEVPSELRVGAQLSAAQGR